jgi:hypothetical protein
VPCCLDTTSQLHWIMLCQRSVCHAAFTLFPSCQWRPLTPHPNLQPPNLVPLCLTCFIVLHTVLELQESPLLKERKDSLKLRDICAAMDASTR